MRDEEILRRRARFVTAALLVAGCSKNEGRSTIEPTPSSEKATPSASTAPTPTPLAKVPPPPDRPSRTATVSATAAPRRDAIVAHADKIHAAVDALAASIPAACKASDAKCVAAWKEFFGRLETARDMNFVAPSCPPKGADEIALDELRNAHAAWHHRWLADIDKAAAAALEKGGPDAKGLSALWDDARNAHARPCLSIACP